MKKIQISMDEELLELVDAMAKKYYTNRSAYISITLAQVIKSQQDAMGIIQQVTEKAIDDKNTKG